MRPQTYPFGHMTSDLDEGVIFFESAASNPTVFGGEGLVSVTRSGAGRYVVTIVGKWAKLVFGGIGVNQSGSNLDAKAHVDKSTVASSSDGRTTSFTVVLVVTATEADSAGAVLTVPFWGWMST